MKTKVPHRFALTYCCHTFGQIAFQILTYQSWRSILSFDNADLRSMCQYVGEATHCRSSVGTPTILNNSQLPYWLGRCLTQHMVLLRTRIPNNIGYPTLLLTSCRFQGRRVCAPRVNRFIFDESTSEDGFESLFVDNFEQTSVNKSVRESWAFCSLPALSRLSLTYDVQLANLSRNAFF